jgi:hypothetical protein
MKKVTGWFRWRKFEQPKINRKVFWFQHKIYPSSFAVVFLDPRTGYGYTCVSHNQEEVSKRGMESKAAAIRAVLSWAANHPNG